MNQPPNSASKFITTTSTSTSISFPKSHQQQNNNTEEKDNESTQNDNKKNLFYFYQNKYQFDSSSSSSHHNINNNNNNNKMINFNLYSPIYQSFNFQNKQQFLSSIPHAPTTTTHNFLQLSQNQNQKNTQLSNNSSSSFSFDPFSPSNNHFFFPSRPSASEWLELIPFEKLMEITTSSTSATNSAASVSSSSSFLKKYSSVKLLRESICYELRRFVATRSGGGVAVLNPNFDNNNSNSSSSSSFFSVLQIESESRRVSMHWEHIVGITTLLEFLDMIYSSTSSSSNNNEMNSNFSSPQNLIKLFLDKYTNKNKNNQSEQKEETSKSNQQQQQNFKKKYGPNTSAGRLYLVQKSCIVARSFLLNFISKHFCCHENQRIQLNPPQFIRPLPYFVILRQEDPKFLEFIKDLNKQQEQFEQQEEAVANKNNNKNTNNANIKKQKKKNPEQKKRTTTRTTTRTNNNNKNKNSSSSSFNPSQITKIIPHEDFSPTIGKSVQENLLLYTMSRITGGRRARNL